MSTHFVFRYHKYFHRRQIMCILFEMIRTTIEGNQLKTVCMFDLKYNNSNLSLVLDHKHSITFIY